MILKRNLLLPPVTSSESLREVLEHFIGNLPGPLLAQHRCVRGSGRVASGPECVQLPGPPVALGIAGATAERSGFDGRLCGYYTQSTAVVNDRLTEH